VAASEGGGAAFREKTEVAIRVAKFYPGALRLDQHPADRFHSL
jgi:hypothetical protein